MVFLYYSEKILTRTEHPRFRTRWINKLTPLITSPGTSYQGAEERDLLRWGRAAGTSRRRTAVAAEERAWQSRWENWIWDLTSVNEGALLWDSVCNVSIHGGGPALCPIRPGRIGFSSRLWC
jgi:hypothetical protein